MVRFSDGPTADVTLLIHATPAEIWPVVTDITLPPDHSNELQRVEWMDGADGPSLGARFAGHNQRDESAWTTESEIVVFEEPRRFSWRVGPSDAAYSTWGFDVDPADGGSHVRQWVRLGPGRSGLTYAIKQHPEAEEEIIAGRLDHFRQSMQRNLDAIAGRVPRQPTAP